MTQTDSNPAPTAPAVEVKTKSLEDILTALATTLETTTKAGLDAQKATQESIAALGAKLEKALETPTNFAIKPKDSDNEDIGAVAVVPNKYQSNSVQAGIKDASPGAPSKTDGSGLAMQEKAVPETPQENQFGTQTSTPRSGANVNPVQKSERVLNPILKEARTGKDLSLIAKEILSGKYGAPEEGVSTW